MFVHMARPKLYVQGVGIAVHAHKYDHAEKLAGGWGGGGHTW